MGLSDPIVVAARRTPVTGSGRGLAGVDAASLAAVVLAGLREELGHLGVPDRIDDVLLGNCCGPGGDVARVAALAAGLGFEVPAVTVDRQCGSGLEAVRLASALVGSGAAGLVLAGGVESASSVAPAPGPDGAADRSARAYRQTRFTPDGFPDPEMGEAAELLAHRCGVTRERQDAYAARSHALVTAAQRAGRFVAELVPVAGVSRDDRPRPGLTTEALARFRPAFAPDGSVTAGNSCGISDGAAAVAMVSERVRAAAGIPGLRVLASAVAGVDPQLPGLGPVPAIHEVLARTGIELTEVGAIEITEAFAAQLLACTDTLGLDPLGADAARVCPQGGAIALGHPWGASGALLLLRLMSVMLRSGPQAPRYGVAACAIAGGQGVAVLVERAGPPDG